VFDGETQIGEIRHKHRVREYFIDLPDEMPAYLQLFLFSMFAFYWLDLGKS